MLLQKRKSIHELADHPAKKPKTQMKTVIRGKPGSKLKSTKAPGKKSAKPKAAPKIKKAKSDIPESERRRSGRSHNISTYTERGDEEDEEEMLEGVAEWEYGNEKEDDDNEDASEPEESGNEDNSDASEPENDEAEDAAEEENEESEPEQPQPKSNGRKLAAPKGKGKAAPAVKASALATARTSTRSTRRRPTKGASDMDVDDDDE